MSKLTRPRQYLPAGALLVACAGLFANVANLLVSVLVAHLLGTSAYGEYGQLIGLYFVISLPGSALAVAVVRRGSLFVVAHDDGDFVAWRSSVRRQSLKVASLTLPVWALATEALHTLLGGPSSLAIFLVGLGAFSWVFLNMERAILQVQRRYRDLSINFVVEGLIRSAAVLILAHWGLSAIALAILLSELATWSHACRVVGPPDRSPSTTSTGVGVRTGIPLMTLSLLALLQYGDVFLVGRMSHAHAGSYATVAQVSKLLVYVAFIVTNFLLPETAISTREGKMQFRPLLLGVGIVSGVAVPMLLVSLVASHRVLALLFPSRDLASTQLLSVLIAATWMLGLIVLGATFLLALGSRTHLVGLVVLTLVTIVWVGAARGNPSLTAWRYFEVLLVGVLGMATYIMQTTRRHRRLGVEAR
jgi:O-antigen/teichoic acid export membrane protein